MPAKSLIQIAVQLSYKRIENMELPESKLKYILSTHKIEYIKKLGSGGFGTVYLGNSISQEFLPLAIKCITNKQLARQPSLQKYLDQEINSMYSVKHQHIVKLLTTFVEAESIFLVMEYCEFGNLYSYQYGMPDKVFRFGESITIFMQIVRGLKAIHQENIIHRDLKCENILLKKIPKQHSYICKIGDFGLAKKLSQTAKSHCGTPNFMAPEILSEKPYDKCVDVWSIGIIFYYMLLADYPFKGLNILNDIENKCSEGYDLLIEANPQLIKKKNKSIGEKELQALRNFFARIFVINPKKRMTLEEISKHPLFQDTIFNLDTQNSSTESSESIDEQKMLSVSKVDFMEHVFSLVKSKEILKNESLLLLKYFFNKVGLCVLLAAQKQMNSTEDKTFKEQFSLKLERIKQEYSKSKKEIERLISNKVSLGINFTLTHLNSSYEKFQFFKDIYRIFLGFVFSQVHSSPIKEKERLKIKVLSCHTINRVFEDKNAKYFQYFSAWSSTKKQKRSKAAFDFDLFLKWVAEDSQENISKTISAINEHFYGKK